MDSAAMEPLGMAMLAYLSGDTDAELTICRDDGHRSPVPVSWFFRNPAESTSIDQVALDHCTGHVLDVGAGSGLHSLNLQEKGLPVTSIDISPQAVDIMRRRGVRDVQCADIFAFQGGPFDTILMMGHGIGVVETVAGLDRFLESARSLLSENGCLLLDSVDVRVTEDPAHLAYHEAATRKGRYFGEVRVQLEFEGKKGPSCGWLHVDPRTLREHAEMAHWRCDVIVSEKSGDYLARLTRLRYNRAQISGV